MPSLFRFLFGSMVCVLAAGCSVLHNTPQVDMPVTSPPQPVAAARSAAAVPRQASGSLFNQVRYRPLFEDRRARMEGDTVTINIVENVSASQKSTSTIDKKGSIDAGITALPFLSANSFKRASANAESEHNFAGKGGTESANTFQGSITATVVDVLPNGHLVVTGEKQIGVNQNVDTLQFTGQVDPQTIVPGNIVQSTQVANVRIQQSGQGAQADAQRVGWLSRFFLSLMPV